MAGTGVSIHIDRPPSAVFRYLIELNDPQWRSGVVAMRLTSDAYEGVGATHVEVRRVPGREVASAAEVVAYDPDRRWAVRRATGPVRPQVTYTLAPEGAGTRLGFTFAVPVLRGAARVLAPLVPLGARAIERAFAADLARLKRHLEDQQRP
jgi:uncharacterized protein YndB with AHSA1/START domain